MPWVVLGPEVTPGGRDGDAGAGAGALSPGLDVGRIIGVPEYRRETTDKGVNVHMQICC